MIREKALEGKSAYAIGKELGISKNTVKKYMDPSPCVRSKYPMRGSKLDPFKPEINRLMESGIFNCVVIMDRIEDLGYEGKISVLKDYVRPFRPPKQVPAVRRYETKPGQQAQMDWGICQYIDTAGITHKVPAFIMILGFSRMRYMEFTKRCDLFSLERCIIDAFEYFGGVPDTVLTDNMKTVIDGRESGKPIWNGAFLDFCCDIGFVPKVCRVRRPETKGKVERLVNYVKSNFIPGREFTDIADLNLQAMSWCEKANAKVSNTTGETAYHMLSSEHMSSLPDPVIRDRYRYESRRVSRDGFISYDGVRYGVPWEYSSRQVTVRAGKDRIEIFDGLQLISEHAVEPRSGRIVYMEGQYRGLAEKHGMAFMPSARQTAGNVEKRSLAVYEELLEVSNG